MTSLWRVSRSSSATALSCAKASTRCLADDAADPDEEDDDVGDKKDAFGNEGDGDDGRTEPPFEGSAERPGWFTAEPELEGTIV